jgi:TrpR-related protein YerC/YecD
MPVKHIDKKRLSDLCKALDTLENSKDIEAFLYDICTPQELAELSDRWHVTRLLDQGEKSYREIAEIAGVSVTTVGRVARFLHQEPHGGYRKVLAKIHR